VSSQEQPHDVVGAHTWQKRWDTGRKGGDTMTVNQGLDLTGRAENGGNPSRAMPQTHLLFSRISRGRPLASGSESLRLGEIFRVNI